ncbi:MAG: tRNA (N(6)-L-threonylcarbamoyladenosine(37)-C(2))-methylthiotransferase MtaB [Deltaproteobacteria bacterium]|nr:tRNA (N(6)-L-threonylcarbamoyladenosine(37)-C(2))-methylthiotransferase MtaB [Deltaproteobacteria bacterium]
MKQASLITLGCKVNSYDTAVIWEGLEKKGYRLSDRVEWAHVYVINTCTVTNSAGSQARQIIRKVKRLNPSSLVVVTGCYAQVSPDEVAAVEGVDYVVGNQEKSRIFDILEKEGPQRDSRVEVGNIFKVKEIDSKPISGFNGRSRAFLKIQDGCEAFCTYCIVPYARGRSRSQLPESVEEQVLALAGNGFSEIVLTGIHLGAYGLDLEEKTSLLGLLKRLDALPLNMRFRISSVEPTEIDDEMLEFLVSSKKICRHLHIPLQSGDDDTLKQMDRKYDTAFYRSKIEKIHKSWKGVSIGIDIMAGFPGESEEAFQKSYNFIKDLPAAYLHVFPYSKRKGTPAAAMTDHINPSVIKERCAVLRDLGNKKKNAFCRSNIGKRLTVLAIGEKEGYLKALSDNYLEIMISCNPVDDPLPFSVKVTELIDFTCYGELV